MSKRNVLLLIGLGIFLAAAIATADCQTKYAEEPVTPEVQAKFDQAVGKAIYMCHSSDIAQLLTRQEDGKSVSYYGSTAGSAFLAPMTPMTIIGIDKLADIGHSYMLGLRLQEGGLMLVLDRIVLDPADLLASPDPLAIIAADSGAFTSIHSSGIRSAELHAVSTGEIHQGMTEREALCALGAPDQVNSYSEGASQDVYDGGRLIVYTQDGFVTNLQRFDR